MTKKTQTDIIDTAETLISTMNEKFFGNQTQDLPEINKGEQELDLISKINSPAEVHKKAMSSMKHVKRPPNPSHRINSDLIPSTFTDEEGKTRSLSDLDPETPPPNTLPATVSKEVVAAGISNIKWTDLGDLPGHADRDIRNMGNTIFQAFGIDKNAQIMTLASFKDNPLLNEPKEMNAVLGFLDKYAASTSLGTMTQDFGNTIEGYAPEIKIYHTPETAYLAVFEGEGMGIEGQYIYAFKRKVDYKLQNERKEILENKSKRRNKLGR